MGRSHAVLWVVIVILEQSHASQHSNDAVSWVVARAGDPVPYFRLWLHDGCTAGLLATGLGPYWMAALLSLYFCRPCAGEHASDVIEATETPGFEQLLRLVEYGHMTASHDGCLGHR